MKKGQTLLEHNFEFYGRCMTKCYNNNSKLLQEEIKSILILENTIQFGILVPQSST
jgi:hypothetical protein